MSAPTPIAHAQHRALPLQPTSALCYLLVVAYTPEGTRSHTRIIAAPTGAQCYDIAGGEYGSQRINHWPLDDGHWLHLTRGRLARISQLGPSTTTLWVHHWLPGMADWATLPSQIPVGDIVAGQHMAPPLNATHRPIRGAPRNYWCGQPPRLGHRIAQHGQPITCPFCQALEGAK